MKTLRLPLKKKWFEMTKAGIKTEDYREINDYWSKILLIQTKDIDYTLSEKQIRVICDNFYKGQNNPNFKEFTTNTMTLGYPKNGDSERIIQFEHAGIEIRTGNPEWGAEPNKLYFVIKHGQIK